MSAPRRCACSVCSAKAVNAALKHIDHGRHEIAAEVLKSLLGSLPPIRLKCDSSTNPRVRQLEEELIECRGWMLAYQSQERARVALGEACPCLARKSA